MHVVIAILYGFTFWLSCLAYAVITQGRWGLVALAMPLFVSGASAVLLTLDLVIHSFILLWRRLRPRTQSVPET